MFFWGNSGEGIPCSPISRGAILPCMELKEALEQANVIIMEEEKAAIAAICPGEGRTNGTV